MGRSGKIDMVIYCHRSTEDNELNFLDEVKARGDKELINIPEVTLWGSKELRISTVLVLI